MKKLMIALAMLLVSGVAMAQDVTTFMGIPIDGTEEAMRNKLKAKGFREVGKDKNLKGEFFGREAYIYVDGHDDLADSVGVVFLCDDDKDATRLYNSIFTGMFEGSKYVHISGDVIENNTDLRQVISAMGKDSVDAWFWQNGDENKPVLLTVTYNTKYGDYDVSMMYWNRKNWYNINNDL